MHDFDSQFHYYQVHNPLFGIMSIAKNKKGTAISSDSFCEIELLNYFTAATTALNASGWFNARSASAFRFNPRFFSVALAMN